MKSGAQAIPKFDPFNMTGLPDHILPQILDDFYFWYNDYAMRCEFQMLDAYIKKQRAAHTPDPLLKGWLDQGLISQNQYDQVALLRGGPSDVYSDIFAKPIGDIPVVPPDRMVPMTAPGSLDRLRHYEEGALDRTIKGGEFLPKVTAFAVGVDGVKRDLRDIDFLGIALGTSEPAPIEGEHLDGEVDRIMQKSGLLGDNGMLDLFKVAALSRRDKPIEGEIVDKGVEVRIIPDDYEFPPHVSKPGDGYKLDHVAPLPSARGIRPLILGQMDTIQSMSQGRGRDETMAVYQEYQGGLGKLMDGLVESRSAEKSLLPKPDLTTGEVGDASAELAKIRRNPLREHWEKHGDPYEGRLPQPTPEQQAAIDQLLQENVDPEIAAKVKSRIRQSIEDLDIADSYPETVEMPPELCTPEQIADAEAAIQEAQEGKLDYLLEGTQWDPKLRK
ncbi:hypothetical protein [Streptomyces sp. CHB9.2]|uniref:hypothetical protein n=1 Tax=Streptomyces sp. CHB9.2 TaxID=2841670 RepID=UPI002094D7FB|nr:hypothetical protein [Streptomyces sp. CHB9.2]MCO6704783.1 hypothetical protein [Streptomyces sp. CHB9.2]